MLTIAALHTMNDTSDPYFTVLQAGSYAKNKPSGTPCDTAFSCRHGLSKNAIIAIAVVVTVVGLAICGLSVWWILLVRRRSRNKREEI